MTRLATCVGAGLLVTLLLFLLMQALINSDRNPFSEAAKGEILEFVRMLEEKEVERERPKPVRPEPPEEMPPELPKPIFDIGATSGVEIGPVEVPMDEKGVIGTEFADGDYLPIVKVAPFYPERARKNGIEGYVLLEFVVTIVGAVRDPIVIEARPQGVFDRAAIEAALKFKYKPRVVNGERMEVSGVRNLFKFELSEG